eukprot:gnl/MRDRNA2_/MRDRNA2_92884_c0_seq1.p1 gnl/MRDRNA2_/MRDRNA2_92884_c0~~gnl/MRDRNA2_/MRDRNA2_92884_c0_seq1.p1  ORF type:complete len:139 (+),score=23.57 gnl/MRDRNA2_/MRDRNA2_92884_c0_seq1:86-502(+)
MAFMLRRLPLFVTVVVSAAAQKPRVSDGGVLLAPRGPSDLHPVIASIQLPTESLEPSDPKAQPLPKGKDDPEDPSPEEYVPMQSVKSVTEDDAPIVQTKNSEILGLGENADNDDELPIAAFLQMQSSARPRRKRVKQV